MCNNSHNRQTNALKKYFDKLKLPSILLLLGVFFVFSNSSFACTTTETGVPPCAYWTRADAVFSGKILKIESASKSEDLPEGVRKVRFQILQNFKGVDNPTFSVVTNEKKSGDEANYKSGQTWIIYASNDIVMKSFAIFRAVRIEPKIESGELETLKNVIAGKTSTAISGKIVSDSLNNKYEFEPVEITIESKGNKLTAHTDADGAFNIPLPSDGTYRVELKFPYKANLKWNENLLGTSFNEGTPSVFKYEVRLNDGDCNFSFFEVLKKMQ